MATTTSPASRFGWPGQTLEYTVHADGVTELAAPATSEKGVNVRIVSTKQTGNGIDARVAVDVSEGVLY